MNTAYDVRIDSRVVRELRGLPERDAERLMKAVDSLAENPRPSHARRLVNRPGWRIRVGVYRILYEVDDRRRVVTVYRAGHRRDVYR